MLLKPRNVLISIKPEYALKIISGEKTIELRRRFPVNEVIGGIALIYASSPLKEIIGYAVIDKVKHLSIDSLWDKCGKQACVEKDFFYSYFNGLNEGFGLVLKDPIEFTEPLNMKQLKEDFLLSVPQSYRYVSENVLSYLAA